MHANIDSFGSPTHLSRAEVKMSQTTRRSFLKTGLAVGGMAATGIVPLVAAKRTATDTVVLGRSKVDVTRLAFGTGTKDRKSVV